jgi:hypothetical protein
MRISQLILCVAFALASFSATAQDKESFFRFGIKGGANVNKIEGKAYKDAFNFNFQAGVFTQFNISKRFGIQPEVNFVQSTSEFADDANNIYDDLFLGGTQKKAKLDILEVPVLLNVNIGPTKKVKLQLGPAYGGVLKETVDSLKANVGSIFKKGDWSGIAGIWIQLPLVNIHARYKMGLSTVNGINTQQTWRNQSIQVGVGLTF